MPQTLNNDDIRCGMLHDYETRIWVNCNWVLDFIENMCSACEKCDTCNYKGWKQEVGIFQYLPSSRQEAFWKDFNYQLPLSFRFELPTKESFEGVDDWVIKDESLEAVAEVWTDLLTDVREEYDDDWTAAKEEYEKSIAKIE